MKTIQELKEVVEQLKRTRHALVNCGKGGETKYSEGYNDAMEAAVGFIDIDIRTIKIRIKVLGS